MKQKKKTNKKKQTEKNTELIRFSEIGVEIKLRTLHCQKFMPQRDIALT